MRILVLAPHPFYQDRGTPIAVDHLLRILSEDKHEVRVITYPEGDEREYPGVTLERLPPWPRVRGVRPGFSWKKVVCDLYMLPRAFRRAREQSYDRVHAVEESVFIALMLKWRFGIPYTYDMDSSLPQQLADRHGAFKLIAPLLRGFERLAVKHAETVVPVCDNLAGVARRQGARSVLVLRDISVTEIGGPDMEPSTAGALEELELEGPVLLYVGNLERYQGIDLLLESMALLAARDETASLVIVGGGESQIRRYSGLADSLGIGSRVRFAGPRPLGELGASLAAADILVSPRIKGDNTPMKLYSYLDSGTPIVATRLPTHTEILDPSNAVLAEPTAADFSEGMLQLVRDPGLRERIGLSGRTLYRDSFGASRFREVVGTLYGER